MANLLKKRNNQFYPTNTRAYGLHLTSPKQKAGFCVPKIVVQQTLVFQINFVVKVTPFGLPQTVLPIIAINKRPWYRIHQHSQTILVIASYQKENVLAQQRIEAWVLSL